MGEGSGRPARSALAVYVEVVRGGAGAELGRGGESLACVCVVCLSSV